MTTVLSNNNKLTRPSPPDIFAFYYRAQEQAKEGTTILLEVKNGTAKVIYIDTAGTKQTEEVTTSSNSR